MGRCDWQQDAERLKDVLKRVTSDNPVKGEWKVLSITNGKVWCDASSLALGAALEIDGKIMEDASWLRKKDDGEHINVAELDESRR